MILAVPEMIGKECRRCKYLYSNGVACCKWLDRRSITMLFSNVEGSASKVQAPCPDVIKMYNKGMCGADFIDQSAAAHHLDRKSTMRSYFVPIFQLVGCSLC